MKVSGLALALVAGSASAYTFTAPRSSIYSVGKSNGLSAGSSRRVSASIKMEDFGLFRGSKSIDYNGIWNDESCISEVGMEKNLNEAGLRYKMNRTAKEADEVGRLDLPGVEVNLPLIGKTFIGPPKVESIWEALGFTATSNNEARQAEKLKGIQKARTSVKGVLNGPGAEIRQKWIEKYGYPRLDGTGGIFYADQLSTDKVPMGGFNMGKGGSIWPVPDAVSGGQYGKNKNPTVDGLPKAKKE